MAQTNFNQTKKQYIIIQMQSKTHPIVNPNSNNTFRQAGNNLIVILSRIHLRQAI
ncbi:MAG: hypothetical protein JWQ54_1944 [Mucilaginibacter sp.]|nr:hypothetical protein [Mucilaginibacter sp.]